MRRITLVLTVVSVLIAPLAAAASGSQPGELTARRLAGGVMASDSAPTLRLVSATPLIVAGSGFEAREQITVTALTSLGPRIVRTRAMPTGRFRVQLGVFTQPCGKPFAVRARGAGGSVARLRLEAPPPCVPPPIG